MIAIFGTVSMCARWVARRALAVAPLPWCGVGALTQF
jgi:hypothetical protein